MSYFTRNDHELLALRGARAAARDEELQLVYDKFMELNYSLHRRFRDHGYDLHPHWNHTSVISSRSVTSSSENDVLCLTYFRSRQQAELVERLMGRDPAAFKTEVELERHPVIELRLSPEAFAVELVVSPNAWWDQQNLVGKLGVARHRETLRGILQRIEGDFCIGFWGGTALDEMHVTARQIVRGNYLNEWMSTFAEGQDWLRIGMWYEVESSSLETHRILSELVQRVGALYSVYSFLLWTSNNDFHSFYQKMGVRSPSLHHA